MSAPKPPRDPRGHSLRVYADIYDSAAFKCLSPHDVMAYLALLRELKGYNNGDLSLPLSRAKSCGISHHRTLARSLRALCAVGLIAITRKGGCTKGGQRLANLYRVTDRECYEIPAKHLTAMKATYEWKTVASIELGHSLIAAAEEAAKATHEKKALGHGVTVTRTRRDVVSPKTRTPRDTWPEGLGHGVTVAEKAANPSTARVSARFSPSPEKAIHRTPRVPPLYIAIPPGEMSTAQDYGDDDGDVEPSYGISSEVISTLAELWAAVGCRSMWTKPTDAERERLHQLAQDSKTERMRRARDAQQRAIDRHRTKPTAATTAGAASLYEEIVRVRDDFSHDTTALND
jgi:predicted transcriptional regulator